MTGTPQLTWGVLLAVLAADTPFGLRSRRVPAWLTGGGIAAGTLLAAWDGPPALTASLGGAAVGGWPSCRSSGGGGWAARTPCCWRRSAPGRAGASRSGPPGGRLSRGAAIALGVWAWRRWRPPRRGASGTPVDGGARGEPFPYVPAVLAGAVLALLSGA